MERLFKADRIHLEQYGSRSRGTWKIVTGGKPQTISPDAPGAD
jgi:hypothetical protein